MLALWIPESRRLILQDCPNPDISHPGPVKFPRLHSWDSSMGGIKGLGTTRSTFHETDRRTLSLGWKAVIYMIVLAVKGLAKCSSACFSSS